MDTSDLDQPSAFVVGGTGVQMVERLAESKQSLFYLHGTGGPGTDMDTRAWRWLTSLEPSRLRGQCPLRSSGVSHRKQGQEGQSSYLGWVLLPALVVCSFDRVGDCVRTIQALWGQRPSHRQDEDMGWPGEHRLVMPGAVPAQHSENWRPEPVLRLTGSRPGWGPAPIGRSF